MKKRIVLYGAGKIGKEAASLLKSNGENVECYIDKNEQKHGKVINGLVVRYLEEVQLIGECIVYVTTVKDITHIIKDLVSVGVKKENVILYDLFRIQYLTKLCNRAENSTDVTEKKHILFDCYNGLGLGGIEEWTKQITTLLCEKDYKAQIIYSGEKKAQNEGLIYVDVVEKDLIYDICKVVDSLIKSGCGMIVTSQPDDVLRAACVMKLMGIDIRIICTIHGGTESNYERYPMYRQFVDAYVGVSEDICQELVKRGIDERKVYHMTCPVKLMKKGKSRTYTMNSQNPINIGYAGRIEIEQKRMDLLLELIFDLQKDNVNYHMNIAGEGSYKEHMESMIKEKGLDSKVDFWGRIDRNRISSFWQHNDICVNVADYEGRSISIMEAMVNAAVPIVTKTSGVKEDIHNGINGFYVDIGDYKKIEQYIVYLDENRMELSRFGENARKEMEEKCDMDKHIGFWCELLEQVNKG